MTGLVIELIGIHTQTHNPTQNEYQIPDSKHQQTQPQHRTQAKTGRPNEIPDRQAKPTQTKTIKANDSIGLEPIL